MHGLNLDIKPFRTTEILSHLFAAHKQNIAGVITVIHANFLRFNVNMCFSMLFSRTAFESIKCYFPVVQQYIIVSRHFIRYFQQTCISCPLRALQCHFREQHSRV